QRRDFGDAFLLPEERRSQSDNRRFVWRSRNRHATATDSDHDPSPCHWSAATPRVVRGIDLRRGLFSRRLFGLALTNVVCAMATTTTGPILAGLSETVLCPMGVATRQAACFPRRRGLERALSGDAIRRPRFRLVWSWL